MDDEFPLHVFKDRRVARGVRDRHVADGRVTIGQDRGAEREGFLLERRHRLLRVAVDRTDHPRQGIDPRLLLRCGRRLGRHHPGRRL